MRSVATFGFLFTLLVATARVEAADRSYEHLPTTQDKSDIRYIVENLSRQSPVWIGLHVAALKRAGDRIEEVHPMRFVEVIFTDESMKVAIRNLRSRGGRYWSEFMSGLRRSFAEERSRGNVHSGHVAELAKAVGIHPDIIQHAVMTGQWDNVVVLLIEHVPRKGDVNRWDL